MQRTKIPFISGLSTLLLASALILSAACSQSNETKDPNPLGSFNFDFKRLAATPTEQLDILEQLGYQGMTMNIGPKVKIELVDQYIEATEGRDFKFYAGYIPALFTEYNTALFAHADEVLKRLKKADAKLWLIIRATELEESKVLEAVRVLIDMSKAAEVEFVLYPHDNTTVQSAEEALVYIDKLNRSEVYISLHLCHEIRAGNGERLTEVAQKIKPYLRLPSISGANSSYVEDGKDWSDSIKALDEGDYDTSKLLQALNDIEYKGPIILHTFGLQKGEADHHHRSMKRYLELQTEAF